ncbi:hypothetical protein [Brevundimonas sp.]|uniref:hypothetical protein n=1 Tax=Brevundimonas sp. TaxID=1871086 RepID=UPI0025C3D53C|nr:hypothetical protein [Brevundimonas sp.]
MPIQLPASPEPCAPYTPPCVVALSNDVTSLIGGNRQKNRRKGDHYAVDFTLPPMNHDEAREWRSLMSAGDTVVMKVPQPGIGTGTPGSPRINGGNQLGDTLNLKGLTPSYVLRKGQMITIVTSGRKWLYGVEAQATANASGQTSVKLEVMIRTLHADNDTVLIAEPEIEGFATFSDDTFKLDDNGYCQPSFMIEERG